MKNTLCCNILRTFLCYAKRKFKGSETMKQILIVEDDSFLNKMLAYNLTADGYEVTSALNTRTATAILNAHEFDLVLFNSSFAHSNWLSS